MKCLFLLGLAMVSARVDAGATEPVRVACVGDSITYGFGLQDRQANAYPAWLGRWLGTNYEVRNFGVSATTLLHRGDYPFIQRPAYTNALAFKANIVVIDFGANDSKHPGDSSLDAAHAVNNWQYKSNFIGDYEAMIAAFRQANPAAQIFICYPTPDFPGRWGINDETIRNELNPMIRIIARKTGVSTINLRSPFVDRPDLFPDTVHPNDTGAKILAEEVFHALTGKSPEESEDENQASVPSPKSRHGKLYEVFPPYFAWNNNFSGKPIGWQPGASEAPQWTASFNFATNGLYGFPASVRGWHYGWNPAGDTLFPKKLASASSIPCSFSYNSGGQDLHGDFAYDAFFRRDDRRAEPQLEVMVWAGNNSTPIGKLMVTNLVQADGVSFDLWAGTNSGAGYFVYSFAPHEKTANLPTEGGLNVDLMDFFKQLQGRPYFSMDMYLDVVEAGFEVVRGNGWVTCGWFSCEAD